METINKEWPKRFRKKGSVEPHTYYDNYANHYDEAVEAFEVKESTTLNEYLTINLLDPNREIKKHTMLDLGCGTGRTSINYARLGMNVMGIDAAPNMLKEYQSKIANEHVVLIQSDLEKGLPFLPENSFDFIVSAGCFCLFENIAFLVQEACRVLRIGGYFGFTFEELGLVENRLQKLRRARVMIYRHLLSDVKKILNSCGCTILKEKKYFLSYNSFYGKIKPSVILAQKTQSM